MNVDVVATAPRFPYLHHDLPWKLSLVTSQEFNFNGVVLPLFADEPSHPAETSG